MNTDTPNAAGDYGGGRDVSPALDATLDLLSNRRRRFVLYALRDREGAMGVEELAEQVAAWERDADESVPASGSSDGVRTQRVLADLHHCQLPRLTEAGAVSYDAEDEFVSLAAADPLAEYLDLAAREEDVR